MVLILRADPCAYCGEPGIDIDHIDAGGTSHWSNLAAACRACNRSKHQTPLVKWLLARLLRAERDAAEAQIALLTDRHW
jgi:5-methylcytosine-specific restriction endonuclease McrA